MTSPLRAKVTAKKKPPPSWGSPRWRATSLLRPVNYHDFSGLKCRVAAVSWLPISVWTNRRVHVSRKTISFHCIACDGKRLKVKCLMFPLSGTLPFTAFFPHALWEIAQNRLYSSRKLGRCVCVEVCVGACYEEFLNISFKLSVSKFHILPTSCSVHLTCKSKITVNISLMFSTHRSNRRSIFGTRLGYKCQECSKLSVVKPVWQIPS